MRRDSEAVKADIRKRMSPPARQSVARISEETGIHIATLYAWRKGWRWRVRWCRHRTRTLRAGALPTSSRWCWTAGLNATELSAYCRERGLYPE